jgi:hypothetical protein
LRAALEHFQIEIVNQTRGSVTITGGTAIRGTRGVIPDQGYHHVGVYTRDFERLGPGAVLRELVFEQKSVQRPREV